MSKVIGVLCLVERADGSMVVMGSRRVAYTHLRLERERRFASVESVLRDELVFSASVVGWEIMEIHTGKALPEPESLMLQSPDVIGGKD